MRFVAGDRVYHPAHETFRRFGRFFHRMLELMRPSLVEVERAATSPFDGQAAVIAAFENYHAEIYNFLRRSTRDDSAAEDLVQEAYLRLTREVSVGRAPDNMRAWLYRVASNLAISRGRRRTTVVAWMSRYGRDTELSDVSSESVVLGRVRTPGLDAAMAALPADARTALLLSAEGFSGEEIAAAIGRSHAATRTLLSRARVRVRLDLERHGDDR
jgi:RNA polymerase sigma-70 factor, ECF subfamily